MTRDEKLYRTIGKEIRRRRERAGLTQAALAQHIGLERTSITNIERGRQRMLVHTLDRIARVLHCPTARLLDA